MNRISNLGYIKHLGRVVGGTDSIAEPWWHVCERNLWQTACGKNWVKCEELCAKGVLRWLHGHLRLRLSCSSLGDKVTWRFSSQPLYLQVSSRIDFAKTSTVQTELGFELSTLCVQAFYCWLWRVPGLLPSFESGWVQPPPPPPPSHLGVELWMCHYSGTWPSQLELLYHYMWEASLCRS